ncbi:MAG: ABC transporter permease, partial [Oscillospiraceae bacterium]|nr:ABC transporter permease [Oscillospiraceae bacterium]
MRSAIVKNTLREIRSTFGRFFAIMAIIALGVGFFTGVRITTPAMTDTINRFLEEQQFYDYRLLSAVGWQEEDIDFFREQKDVRFAEGAYSIDFISAGLNEHVMKAHSITEGVNSVKLTEGRMPENENECIAERGKATVGSQIFLAESNPDSVRSRLKTDTFTVVGLADSPLYINFERGNTSLGNGEIKTFVYLPKEAFNIEVYTEAYIRFDQDHTIYSDEYEEYMDGREKQWKSLTDSRAKLQSDKIYEEAKQKLNDGKAEFEEKRNEGKQQLDEAKQKIDDGKAELDRQLEELEKIKDVMPEQYAYGKEQYDSAYSEY